MTGVDAVLTIVPLTWVVTWPFSLSDKSLERPKSATFAFKCSSNRMLFDFMSLWMMGGSASSCRYARPLAEPSATLSLLLQSNLIPDFPAYGSDCWMVSLFISVSYVVRWRNGSSIRTWQRFLETPIGNILIYQHLFTQLKAETQEAHDIFMVNPW